MNSHGHPELQAIQTIVPPPLIIVTVVPAVSNTRPRGQVPGSILLVLTFQRMLQCSTLLHHDPAAIDVDPQCREQQSFQRVDLELDYFERPIMSAVRGSCGIYY